MKHQSWPSIQLSSGRSIPHFGLGNSQASSAVEVITEALRVGYRHFDTAQLYGTEKEVAEAISRTSIPRSEIFVTTKWFPPENLSEPGVDSETVYQDLRRSHDIFVPKIGYIDLVLIHNNRPGPIGRAKHWAALVCAQKEGWIRDIGVSNFNPAHLEALPPPVPVVNQIELHPWYQQPEIVQYCEQRGIVLTAFAPFVRNDPKKIGEPKVVGIAKKHGKQVAHVLFRWSLQRGFTLIPGTSTPSRTGENADIWDFRLDQEDMATLNSLDMGEAGRVTGAITSGP